MYQKKLSANGCSTEWEKKLFPRYVQTEANRIYKELKNINVKETNCQSTKELTKWTGSFQKKRHKWPITIFKSLWHSKSLGKFKLKHFESPTSFQSEIWQWILEKRRIKNSPPPLMVEGKLSATIEINLEVPKKNKNRFII